MEHSTKMFLPCLLYLATASLSDIRTGRIPNSITLGFAAAAMSLDALKAPSKIPLKLSCAAFFLAVFLAVALASKGLGCGDVKLAAAVGYCSGFLRASVSFILACMIGIVFFMVCRACGKKNARVPFAPFAAIGYAASALVYGRIL